MIFSESGLIKVSALFLFLVAASYLLSVLWTGILSGKKYHLIVFPGVVIHEISHMLGCLITFAKIKEVKFFSSQGGYVKHSKPKVPIIGNLIISFAPILGGIVFLALASGVLNLSFAVTASLSGSFYESFLASIKDVFHFFSVNWGGWKMWFFLYLSVSVIISLVPSRQDFKNSFKSIIGLIILFIALRYFNFSPDITGNTEVFLAGILMNTVLTGIAALALSLPIYAIKKII